MMNWKDLTEKYFDPEDFIQELKDEMTADLEKAWSHILRQKDKGTNREYWFMTEWHASLEKHLI